MKEKQEIVKLGEGAILAISKAPKHFENDSKINPEKKIHTWSMGIQLSDSNWYNARMIGNPGNAPDKLMEMFKNLKSGDTVEVFGTKGKYENVTSIGKISNGENEAIRVGSTTETSPQNGAETQLIDNTVKMNTRGIDAFKPASEITPDELLADEAAHLMQLCKDRVEKIFNCEINIQGAILNPDILSCVNSMFIFITRRKYKDRF